MPPGPHPHQGPAQGHAQSGYGGYGAPPTGGIAEWWQRLVARIIDAVIVFVPVFLVNLLLGSVLLSARPILIDPETNQVVPSGSLVAMTLLMLVISTVIVLLYEGLCLMKWGATVGKRALGLRVVPQRGPRGVGLPPGTSFLRALAWWIYVPLNFVPVVSWFSWLWPIINGLWPLWDRPDRQSLNDKIARTVVVRG
ncbi:RDD family protein [Marinactinospora thermotolerans]|uniref:Uncharacterized membrane protein YckC, RDD family n=1 Tax=Marinactinospora thermotolerans DSM 45154 TaxID=1122192 RepID=A0A1T4S1C8_9ACTN|nr:RDD family protein [Marinactinospora thermotolerans]SKA22054.1 Uncharacterized membrane protein YckC, RDD family [Marinactinospora thermotolerans DSM 45154]